MTNNLKMINRLTELMNEIDTIKEEIKEIILKLEVDPIPEAVTMYDTSKNILCTNVINKFLRENGTIKPGNKINDYEFRDDLDAFAIREKCNFTTRDGRTFEFWVEWGYQTILREIKEPITY